jgi:small subunit ribosomal protein S16
MVIVRLKRGGAKRKPCYRIVAADNRKPRDGRNIEEIGYYHPCSNPVVFKVDAKRLKHYMDQGAQLSATVASQVKQFGVLKELEVGE